MVGALSRRGMGGPARPVLNCPLPSARLGTGMAVADSLAAASQAGGGRDRRAAAAGALHSKCCADPLGLESLALPEPDAARATLRVEPPRRAGARGHQETATHRATEPSRHRQSPTLAA